MVTKSTIDLEPRITAVTQTPPAFGQAQMSSDHAHQWHTAGDSPSVAHLYVLPITPASRPPLNIGHPSLPRLLSDGTRQDPHYKLAPQVIPPWVRAVAVSGKYLRIYPRWIPAVGEMRCSEDLQRRLGSTLGHVMPSCHWHHDGCIILHIVLRPRCLSTINSSLSVRKEVFLLLAQHSFVPFQGAGW